MTLSENTTLSRIIRKFLIFFSSLYFVLNLVSHYIVNDDISRYFLGDNFLVSSLHVSVVIYRQVSLNSTRIVKYCSTEISKVFENYPQISSEFMTNSIELQILSEDAAS